MTGHTSLSTHLCSLHGRYRWTPPLCGRTRHHSDRGWSSTGWSLSRSNRPWSQPGSGSEGPRWGGWDGTRWRARKWRGRSCWSAAPRRTSCSSCTALGDTRCHRMGEPAETGESTGRNANIVLKTQKTTNNTIGAENTKDIEGNFF